MSHPIHRAVKRGDLAALRRELAAGVNPNIIDSQYQGGTPLNLLCNHGWSAFISDETRLQCVQALLEAGASPNLMSNDYPLTLAAACGDAAIVRALLAAGADATQADSVGWTALHAALGGYEKVPGRVACVAALIEAGADLEANNRPPPHTFGVTIPTFWQGTSVGTAPPRPLALAVNCHYRSQREKRVLVPMLLRAGARNDVYLYPPYTVKVDAAGGWKKYEQVHLKRLVPTISKVFPLLPEEVVSQIVYFWAHVGYY